jgi:hypothetical protein
MFAPSNRSNEEEETMHAPTAPAADERLSPDLQQKAADNLPIGYLRTFAVLLVLAHHAVLAYHPYAPAPLSSLLAEPRWWKAFPVLDPQRSDLVALFAGWNDIFFMALLFFVSGLFVSRSLAHKGAKLFLGRRLQRLGLPFLVLAAIVAPVAYYPAYLATAAPGGISGFARVWLSLGEWPSGPAWFLWLLLAFAAVAAGLFALRPGWAESLARSLSAVTARPVVCFALLIAITALVYLPLASVVGPLHWTIFGPFAFQTSRLLHYALYFFGGIVIGAQGLEQGLLAPGGRLAQRWPLWAGGALLAYAFAVAAAVAAFAEGASAATLAIANLGFVVSCAASCFALLALFLRFVRTPRPVFDSLRGNAYGMYVVHYAFASWLQHAFLRAPLPALGKATGVILATVVLSWAASAALRQVPAIRRVL